MIPATRLSSFQDLYQNVTHHFDIQSPHQKLDIESTLKIQNLPLELSGSDHDATLEFYNDPAVSMKTWSFLQPSNFVVKTPDIWRQGIDISWDFKTVLEKARSLMAWIHANYKYDPDSTKVNSRVDEVFELRSGVCQDFSHVLIALCRSIGIPARYASGYLYNGPSGTHLGAQASHAWAEIYLPQSGWIGLDPTNNTLADARYIKVAVGRDYDDVAPVKGRYTGTSACRMVVDVAVTLI